VSDRPLTVIIPCKDERKNIRLCIESVQGLADEVLVADSGSTDGTLDIVRSIGGCRVIQREYIHSGDFKNWAIPQATHAWVLLVDADERVTPKLRREIVETLDSSQADGYWIRRENYFLGHRIRFSGWASDCCLRLFRRDLARYAGDTDHAEVEIESGRVGRLKHRLQHFTCWSYDQYIRKLDRYTSWQAQQWHLAGRQPSLPRLLLNGPARFLHSYFIRLGFVDGMAGFQVCALTGFYSFLKQARLWQLVHGKEQPDPELAVDAATNEDPCFLSTKRSKVASRIQHPAVNFEVRRELEC
jgi:glycosyltransferase involved in cell wall biosynthesis